jgi:hypothetical protein
MFLRVKEEAAQAGQVAKGMLARSLSEGRLKGEVVIKVVANYSTVHGSSRAREEASDGIEAVHSTDLPEAVPEDNEVDHTLELGDPKLGETTERDGSSVGIWR